MMKKIKFTICLETNILDDEDYMKLQEPFYSRIIDTEIPPMSFEEINWILQLDKLKFHPVGIEFSDMKFSDDEFEIGETKIKIKA